VGIRIRVAIATTALLVSGGLLTVTGSTAASAADDAAESADTAAESADAATAPASCPKNPAVGKVCGHTRILLVRYSVKTECRIQDNYPVNPGASPKTWTVAPGATIIWRYNVNDHVALISDPAKNGFPHWGFVTNSECIGTTLRQQGTYWRFEKPTNGKARWVKHKTPLIPAGQSIPRRTFAGRSQNARTNYWNSVDWTPAAAGTTLAARKLSHNRTLRDRPAEFVIGNVKAGWQVRPTNEHRSGYTKVYVPSLKRWGWLQL
jgi:hypothetical protein